RLLGIFEVEQLDVVGAVVAARLPDDPAAVRARRLLRLVVVGQPDRRARAGAEGSSADLPVALGALLPNGPAAARAQRPGARSAIGKNCVRASQIVDPDKARCEAGLS